MGRKLYVGGLSFGTSEETLEATFARIGTVDSVRIITDRDTGRAKGFGFVEMSTDAEAQEAINSLNSTELDGRTITVTEARPQQPREGGYGNRGGGGYGGNRGGGYGGNNRGGGNSGGGYRSRY